MNELLVALGQGRPVFWYAKDRKEAGGKGAWEVHNTVDLERARDSCLGVFYAVNELGTAPNEDGNLRYGGNVLRPLACFADFDRGTFEEQMAKILASPIQPSAFVRSGHGFHVYWFLKDAKKENLPAWIDTQKRIAAFFGSDEAVHDPARLMRLPGSWHVKDEEAKLVTLERCDPEIRYTVQEIQSTFPVFSYLTKGDNGLEKILKEVALEGSRNTRMTQFIGHCMARFKPAEWSSVVWALSQSFNSTQLETPLDDEELRGVFDSISGRELQKRKIEGTGIPVFREGDMNPHIEERDQETIIITIPTEDGHARFTFEGIEQSKADELKAVLTTELLIPGSHPMPYSLRVNVLSSSTRRDYISGLSKSLGKDVKWDLLFNRAAWSLQEHLAGRDTSVDLSDVSDVAAPMLFNPFLSKNSANLLFGDGGTGKTFLALRLAISLATGRDFLGHTSLHTTNTLFVDFEDTEQTASYRISMLCRGMGLDPQEIKPHIRYFNPGGMTLAAVVPALKKLIAKHRIGLLLVDSVTSACGNEPERAESASLYYGVLRRLGITSLSIAHVSKSSTESSEQKYSFGSVFWHNLARNTWNVRGEEETPADELTDMFGEKAKQLGMFHRKCNNGPRARPVPLRIVYGSDKVTIEQGNIGFWEMNLNPQERIRKAILRNPATLRDLKDTFGDIPGKTLESALYRLKAEGMIIQDEGRGGCYRRKT